MMRGGRVTSRDGTRLAYLEMGTGPTIVLVHGGLGTGLGWLAVAPILSRRYRLILLDRRAHGSSEPGRTPYSLEKEAEDVLGVCEATGPIAALFGHSYGAVVALHAALNSRSGLIPRLILYEPPLPVDEPFGGAFKDEFRQMVEAGDYEASLIRYLPNFGTRREDVEALRTLPTWATIVALAPTAVAELEAVDAIGSGLERYRDLEMPTLLLLGSETPANLRNATNALAAAIPQARKVLLEGQAHHATVYAPELVAEQVVRFVSDSRLAQPDR